ncbi:unnamed protein product, partial [Medioppia subpectinata]
MVKDFNVFPDHKHFHMGSSKLDKSLFFMPGDDDWKRVRSILSPVFTSGKLRAMMAHIGGISDGLVHSLSEFEKNGKPVDMRKYIGAFAMDVISACAYGINPQSTSNPDHPIVTNAKSILGLDAGLNQILSVLTPALARFLNLEPFPVKAVDYFDDLTNQILKERKVNNKYIIINNNKHKKRTDFIQLMIDSEKSDKESGYYSGSEPEVDDESIGGQLPKKVVGTLTPDELTAQGILFFIAGYDTTSAALTHAIHYLSKHPDCQQILYEELRSCDEFTYEKLSQLKYLNAVINETLRLAPSLTRIQRECVQDYKLGNTGITVPAGASVEIYPYAIQRDPDFWPNPNDFIPDRFLNPVHHPYAYLPFGGGPRICIGQSYLRRKFTYWTRNGVPGSNYPEYEAYIGVHHDWTVELVKKWGRVYGTYTGFRRSIVINEPDLLRDIMVKDFNVFPNHKNFHMGSSKLSQSLFFMPGDDDWKRVRSILSPVFTSGKLRAMLSHIGGISDGLVENLSQFEKGKPVDMRKYIGAFAMDVISACAYGINPQSISNPDHPIVTNAKSILGVDAGVSVILSVMTPRLGRFLNLEPFPVNAVDYFDSLTKQILSERKVNNKYMTINNNKYSEKSDKETGYYSGSEPEVDDESIGGQLPKKGLGTLTPDQMVAQGLLFFIAGYDTTSAALTHAIHYLSKHPDCQQILYEELRSCDEFTYEKLSQLKYLNAVINETLRLAPSLTRIQRECVQDYKLGNTGITVPAGASVEIFPYAIHRDPDFWPNPNDFIPDRFLEPTHHPYAYIPFGGGPRVCIGQRFALQEMRMCMAKLIHHFEFIASNKAKIEYFTGNILMSPK